MLQWYTKISGVSIVCIPINYENVTCNRVVFRTVICNYISTIKTNVLFKFDL